MLRCCVSRLAVRTWAMKSSRRSFSISSSSTSLVCNTDTHSSICGYLMLKLSVTAEPIRPIPAAAASRSAHQQAHRLLLPAADPCYAAASGSPAILLCQLHYGICVSS